ncbi:MAG: methyltransferase domain-containing protein [Actinomycetota bacterium]
MTDPNESVRATSYGQTWDATALDRLGVWLSDYQIRRHVADFRGKRVADFGCGYHAPFLRRVSGQTAASLAVDVSLSPDLGTVAGLTAIEGVLPGVIEEIGSESLDIVLCVSVLEHLWDPLSAIRGFRRVLAPGGVALLNVPTWRGKWFLEFSAFRLGMSPPEEMDDHKAYYDPSDLWPLLVQAGFLPHNIDCSRHKFGLNTFAACRVDAAVDR